MVDASSSPTCTVASPISPSSRTSSATWARIRSASGRPSIKVAANLDGKLDPADVQPERLREANADLEVLLEVLDVSRAHRGADESPLLRAPERMLDEDRQQPVRRVHELLLRLVAGGLEQHLLVGHPSAVVDPVVGREPVAEVFEDGAA